MKTAAAKSAADPAAHETERGDRSRPPAEVNPLWLALTLGSSSLRRKCAACEEEEREGLQRAATDPAPGEIPRSVAGALDEPGKTLDASTRDHFEPLFGVDLGDVRVHTGSLASESARAVGALAYTVGPHIVFRDGQFDPGSRTGRKLLGHELVHTRQAAAPGPRRRGAISQPGDESEREAEHAAAQLDAGRPIAIGRTPGSLVSRTLDPNPSFVLPDLHDPAHIYFGFDGVVVTPDGRDRFGQGSKIVQATAVLLSVWAPAEYSHDFVKTVYAALAAAFPGADPLKAFRGDARTGDHIPTPFHLDAVYASWILAYLDSHGVKARVTAAQRELLDLGLAIRDLVKLYKAGSLGVTFPAWYSIDRLGPDDFANFGVQLRAFAKARTAWLGSKTADAQKAMLDAATALLRATAGPILALESIRKDADLAGHPAYTLIWSTAAPAKVEVGQALPGAPAAGTSTAGTPAPPTQAPNPKFALAFFGFARTQGDLLAQVDDPSDGPKARRTLLDEFIEWVPQAMAVAPADTKIFDSPAMANLRPHPARLFAVPPIGPPLFDAAIQSDYHFTMQMDFPDVFSAMVQFSFAWERLKVNDKQMHAAVDFSKEKGETPSLGEVASLRYKRVGQYAYEDISRTIGTYTNLVGPPGQSVELVALNSAFRFLGTTFRLAADALTTPRDEKPIAFPDGEGLYIVTCRANQVERGKGFIRAQSVAWMPVFVRDAGQMAEIRLAAAVSDREAAKKRLDEIRKLLANPKTPDRDALVAEGEALDKSLRSHAEALEAQYNALTTRKQDLEKQIASLEGNPDKAGDVWRLREELRAVERQLDPVADIRKTREGRASKLKDAQDLTAVFVSDEGQTLYLALEAARESRDPATQTETWYVADGTTAKGGEATGTGKGAHARTDAILAAALDILEGDKGYGRGQLSIQIGSESFNRRVAESSGKMVLEAMEGVATALSVAAVVAAPFTGGASLVLMVPAGLIGAAPSAYRIVRNVKDGTFRLDLEFAMDVVNIVGSLAGLGEAAVPVRFVRVGQALLVIGAGANGLGVLLMGAQIMEQLLSLSDLPPGMRAARILQIIGQAMLQAGIMVGAHLIEQARAGHVEGAIQGSEGPKLPEHVQKAFEDWRASLQPETRTALDADPSLEQLYREMDPRVRRALTLCASDCVPTKPRPTADDIKRIYESIDRLGLAPGDQGLREYLHRNRNDLTAAVDALEKAKTPADAVRVFERSIASHAEGGNATLTADRRWSYKRDSDGVVVLEYTIAPHGDNTDFGSSGFFQSHHGIQDAWAIDAGLEKYGYARDDCPAILLRDSHAGSPHQRVTARQKARESGRSTSTYDQERMNLRNDMVAAEVPTKYQEELLRQSDKYFEGIYNQMERALRAQGVTDVDAQLKRVFGGWYPGRP